MDYKFQEKSDPENIDKELLLLAEPEEKNINEYLLKTICHVCIFKDKIIGAILSIDTRPRTREIINISVFPEYQNQGIGKRLIELSIKKAKEDGIKAMEIGTGNPGVVQMLLYQKCGFRIIGIDFDYFRKNHEERIYENGIECRDMIRMRLEF